MRVTTAHWRMLALLLVVSLLGVLMTGAPTDALALASEGGDGGSSPVHGRSKLVAASAPMMAMASAPQMADSAMMRGGPEFAVGGMPAPAPMPPPHAFSGQGGGGGFAELFDNSALPPLAPVEVIIREAYVNAELADVPAGVQAVSALATRFKGQVRGAHFSRRAAGVSQHRCTTCAHSH